MVILEGVRSPEKRRDRVRLYALDPVSEGLLSGLPYEVEDIHELRAFCKAWVRSRNAYDIARRRSSHGLFGRLRRDDADAALRRALAELEGAEL
jgi:hypothetical protein